MKILSRLLLLLLTAGTLGAQNLLKEPFDYPQRDSVDGMGGWFNATSAKPKVAVVSPGLVFSNYAANGVGNAARFFYTAAAGLQTMQLSKVDSGSLYLSYLMRIDSLPATATVGYTVTMDQYGGATNVNLRAYVQRLTDSTFKLGVTKLQGAQFSSRIFKTKQTLLVVLRYTFVAGANNDTASLYVFDGYAPSTEPSKADTVVGSGADVADIGEIWLANGFVDTGLKGAVMIVDEIRVGKSWATSVQEPATSLLTEDFYYAMGDTLRGKNGWAVVNEGPPAVVDSLGLLTTGYPGSGRGRSLRITGGSGAQSLYRNFLAIDDTDLYVSGMVNISGTNATGGYFLSLCSPGSGNYRALIYAKIESGNLFFGLRPTLSGTIVYDSIKYFPGQTYVLVLKYQNVPGTNNDVISLFVLPFGVPATEPARANVGPLPMPADAPSVGAVTLNSGGFTAGPLQGAVIRVDGIHVARRPWKSGLTGIGRNAAAVRSFSMEQNYPNPFNPTTAISYQLSARGMTTLTVYDLLGREVSTLVNGMQEPGRYSVRFDGAQLASGMYLARMQSGANVQVMKMMLMK